MSRKIILAKSGFNALTETDPNNFIFHSDYNTFKIVAQGTLENQTVNADPTTFTLTHGKSYTPNFYAFCLFPDGKVALPDEIDYQYKDQVTDAYGTFTCEVDATNIYFHCTKKRASNFDIDIAYYIFEVPV